MKLYNSRRGVLIEYQNAYFLSDESLDYWINVDRVSESIKHFCSRNAPYQQAEEAMANELLPPIQNQEVWASGVTYFRSKLEREKESESTDGGSFYDRVYNAERPELFFKATPQRTVGHRQHVRIRKDSTWNVPEPELTLVMNNRGEIIGYTNGNDMSSRSIEGENPLYLAQAKTFEGCAAIGPGILICDGTVNMNQSISLKIWRAGAILFDESILMNQMKRPLDNMVSYLFRECSFPNGCMLMTGTGIIPPLDFTLQPKDEIHISIEAVGTLVNWVAAE